MNAERLLKFYEKIAEAPDAIARLRQFILDLSVRGKLVPQNPNEKLPQHIVKTSKSRDGAFDLPPNWVWASVGEVSNTRLGKMLDKAKNKGTPQPYLRNLNVRWFGFDLTDLLEMPFERDELEEFALKRGDVLICEGGEPGRAAVWRNEMRGIYFQKAIHRVRFTTDIDPNFFVFALRASALDGRLAESFTGTGIKHFTGKGLGAYLFPLPPLAEQHRIVAKVDELMALCDQLEAARNEREAARDGLTAASLARINTPDPETFTDDARFALDALPALTTRPDQIKQLRQTILNLAVRGKLVQQNPSDEPASKLLKEIDDKRAKLLKSGYPTSDEARTQAKKLHEQSVPESLAKIPDGWVWATLLQCSAFVIDCKNKTAPYSQSGIRLIRTTNVRDGRMNLNDQKYVDQRTYETWSARGKPEPGDILVTREAPMGEVCLIPPGEVICLGQRMMLARLVPDTIDRQFMLYSLRDPNLMDRVQDKPIGATVQHLRVGGVESLLVPLPPLAEQRRIVAKLDVLLRLCDQLEASLSSAAETRNSLLNALLAEALAPAEENREAA